MEMRILAFFNKQKRNKHLSIIRKRIKRLFTGTLRTTPVFVFGVQRSGTTMLMNVFHLHPDTEVFDESIKNVAFLDYRIRDFETLSRLIKENKSAFACFKPLADSHLIKEFALRFSNARFLWIYRDYRDVANSSLRKWQHATRAIKIVCKNQKGGGWFQEGLSEETAGILMKMYSEHAGLSEFDLACLVWWARNRIFVEQNLVTLRNLMLMRYENLVSLSEESFRRLFSFVGMRYCEEALIDIHRTSIKKHSYPEINPVVKDLCDDLMWQLDNQVIKNK